MHINLKALIVVLGIAMAVFAIAKPICLRFIAEGDYLRRRNIWIAMTVIAFITPDFWVFVFVAMPIFALSARKDTNPVAFYLLVMHVIPPIGMEIPVVVINKLFELNNYRILAFTILIPTAWRLVQSNDKNKLGELTRMDILILVYLGLQLVLLMPYESITNTMRRGFLFSIDDLLVYFVVSRTCTNRRAIAESMASFCLACAILAPLALYESLRGWLLYQGIGEEWGNPTPFVYLMRDGTLRAQVSAGHALALGYMMAIAFGFWLYLRSRIQSKALTISVAIWMWVGLLAAYSRAPWLVAVVIFFAYVALGPNGPARFFKSLLIATFVAGLVLFSPIGERVIDNLPFVGTVDAANVIYRQQFLEISWQLIKQNPFFGNPFILLYLEDLRQGQGIIDLINTYTTIAMYYGLVGLSILVGFFLIGIWNVHRIVKQSAGSDPDKSLLGVSLIICMFGTLLMMAAGSFGTSLEKMFYVLAGLAAGYAQLGQAKETIYPEGLTHAASDLNAVEKLRV